MGQAASVKLNRSAHALQSVAPDAANRQRLACTSVEPAVAAAAGTVSEQSINMSRLSTKRTVSTRSVVPIALFDDNGECASAHSPSATVLPTSSAISSSSCDKSECLSSFPQYCNPSEVQDAMFHPALLAFLTCREIASLSAVTKAWQQLASSEDTWRCICATAAVEYMLLLPRR